MDWESVGSYQVASEISSWDSTVTPPRPLYRVYIAGVNGTLYADDLVCIINRFDFIDYLYWDIQAVLDGHYHCCLTGKCWALL